MLIDHKPLPDKIADFIRGQIIQGKLKPGEKILEAQLAEDLNISRTPIREAIRLLECEGFVELLPRRGAIVKEFSHKDFKDIIEIKECLECLAVELAMDKIDSKGITKLKNILKNEKELLDKENEKEIFYKFFKEVSKFHDTIMEYCDNRHLVDLNIKIENHMKRYRFFYIRYPEIFKKIYEAQSGILKAIQNKDRDLLKKSYHEYIKSPYSIFIKKLNNEKN